MSEEERERLKAKEQRKNPGGALNDAWAQAHTGAPSGSGCLALLIIAAIILLLETCSK
ncbi:hypothetical protein MHZ92_18500 [Sporosarcina sp. ACRSL]|uniref:DUF6366 family protein n=1 Tax=Sporosarcina sp. ACRSL TaxID=2918215 RepID=UPI001EF55B71|nr:DUF6366 family protein [Sporosarcina sp. ACRSL]MCG7346104.1 hypothetical protein [Sporosarcina sp. ACRSL]